MLHNGNRWYLMEIPQDIEGIISVGQIDFARMFA
jgi:hypothetical protein